MKTLLSLALLLASSLPVVAQERTRRPTGPVPFHVEEKTIAQIHAALRSRRVTCRGLVEAYLARINAYDQKGPSLNAVVLLNPEALQTADELDARMKSDISDWAMRPLECIPVVVKDNYETKALRTTAGSQSLARFIPTRDAFVVRKIREAGAIILRGATLPAGLTIFGRPWDEGHLFAFAYAYEQATHHRKPPPTTPPVK